MEFAEFQKQILVHFLHYFQKELNKLLNETGFLEAQKTGVLAKFHEINKETEEFKKELEKDHPKTHKQRRGMVGSGDRSERIRTYNFPQGRLTDHRINLTLYKLEEILLGKLEQVIDPLLSHHQAEMLKAS